MYNVESYSQEKKEGQEYVDGLDISTVFTQKKLWDSSSVVVIKGNWEGKYFLKQDEIKKMLQYFKFYVKQCPRNKYLKISGFSPAGNAAAIHGKEEK